MRTLLVVALGGSCDGRVAVMVMKPSGFFALNLVVLVDSRSMCSATRDA
jgi:hypothetical protein